MAGSQPSVRKSYKVGDVGPGATAVVGDMNQVIGNSVAALENGEEIRRLFEGLVGRIQAADLDDATRDVALEKAKAVAEGLAVAKQSPGKLHRALLDAKAFLESAAGWAWDELSSIIQSEAVQKTVGTITEAGTRAAIRTLTGG